MRCGAPNCQFSRDDPTKILEHMSKEHKRVNLFSCKICSKYFTIPRNLIHHMETECFKRKEPIKELGVPPPKDPPPSLDPTKPLKTLSGKSKPFSMKPHRQPMRIKSAKDPPKPTLNKFSRSKKQVKPYVQTLTTGTSQTKLKRQVTMKKRAECNEPTKHCSTKRSSERILSLKLKKSPNGSWKTSVGHFQFCSSLDDPSHKSVISRKSARTARLIKGKHSSISESNCSYTDAVSSADNFSFDNENEGNAPKRPKQVSQVAKLNLATKSQERTLSKMTGNEPLIGKSNKDDSYFQFEKDSGFVTEQPETLQAGQERGSKRGLEVPRLIPLNHQSNSSEEKPKKRGRPRKKKLVETVTSREVTPLYPQKKPENYKQWNDWWISVTRSKSSLALEQLQQEESLRHFFTCMDYSCHFHTNNSTDFVRHQIQEHPSKKLPCRYCFEHFEAGVSLMDHTTSVHGTLTKQCSRCLYRAATISQVSLHFAVMHEGEPVIYDCESVREGRLGVAENVGQVVAAPIMCRTDQCETDDPKVVSDTVHKYQCAYCNNRTDTIAKTLLHQCLIHAEHPMQLNIGPSSYSKNESHSECNETKVETKTNVNIPDYQTKTNVNIPDYQTKTNVNIPDYHPNCTINFSCGIQTCHYVLDGIDSYDEHLLTSHHSNAFYPCPHCTEIRNTLTSFGEHLSMHGNTMYSCTHTDCFYHWDKGVVVAHCRDKHQDSSANVVTVRELKCDEMITKPLAREQGNTETVDFKINPLHIKLDSGAEYVPTGNTQVLPLNKMPEPIPSHSYRGNCINFHLQLSGNILSNPIHQTYSLERSKCTCGTVSGEVVGCLSCSKKFESQEILVNRNTDNTTICENKPNDVNAKAELLTNTPRVCSFCGFITKGKETFKEHLYHELGYSPFYCNICEFKAVSRDGIMQHIQDRHPDAFGSACNEFHNETFESLISLYIDTGTTNSCISEDIFSNIVKSFPSRDLSKQSNKRHDQHLSDHLQSQSFASASVSDTHACENQAVEELCSSNIRIEKVEGCTEEKPSNPLTIDLECPVPAETKNCISTGNNSVGQLEPKSVKVNGESQLPVSKPCPASKRSLSSKEVEMDDVQVDRNSQLTKPCSSKQSLSSKVEVEVDDDIQIVFSEYEDVEVVFSNINQRKSLLENDRPEKAPEYFSFYGKESDPIDLGNISVLAPPISGLRIKIPAEDVMKLSNFDAGVKLPDLRKTFFNGI